MVLDLNALWRLANDRAGSYAAAEPFEHIVINDFLTPEGLELALKAFPPMGDPSWKLPVHKHAVNKYVSDYDKRHLKDTLFNEDAQKLFWHLTAGSFLHFLEILTRIEGVMSDPYFVEGGFHCVGDKGKLDIHADFTHHGGLSLQRRINLLLYLNADWKPSYGGGLGLYDEKLERKVYIRPILNRCVIFNTSYTSYHGHPEPMNLPEGVMRKSIALYYYTKPTGIQPRKIHFPEDA